MGSLAVNLDADLLGEIEILDSDVSAKLGDFQGGAINAKTRDPRRGFYGVLSSSFTSGRWQKTFIDPLVRQNYKNATGWMDKSDFTKNRYRFGVEGWTSDEFGLLVDFSQNLSRIKSTTKSSILDPSVAQFPDEKRAATNVLVNGVYVGDNFELRPMYGYFLQKNRSFIEHDLNSAMSAKFGGHMMNLAAGSQFGRVNVEQSLNYSSFESSRAFDFKKGLYAYRWSNLRPWGTSLDRNGNQMSYYGGLGDILERQISLRYRLDLLLDEFSSNGVNHALAGGFAYDGRRASYETPNPFIEFAAPKELPHGYACKKGDLTCLNDDSLGGAGQFLSQKSYYGDVSNVSRAHKFALYLEDDARMGEFRLRGGVRASKSSFNQDLNLAPRFLSEYEVSQSTLGLGLNRYYGRDLFAHKIYADMYAHYKDYERNGPSDEFKVVSQDLNGF